MALLATIVVLEGARRVRTGDVILRRLLSGPWSATDPDAERRRWSLVSWLPPVWTTVVASPATKTPSPAPPAPSASLAAGLAAVRPWYRALTVLGTVVLVVLVIGLPFAERHSTGIGVLLAIGATMLLALGTAFVSWYARRRLGLPRSPAWTALSPFAAPYAAERLLEHTLAPHATVVVARSLLPPQQFRHWIRPRAYDAMAGAADPELRSALNGQELQEILAPPRHADDAPLFCPRCGAVYREADVCADCATVRLQAFAIS